MIAWTPVPEPVTWTMPAPISGDGGLTYATVTLRAPSGEDVLKAMAIPGASNADITHRLIESVSAEHVPYDVVKKLPWWMITQMSDYMDSFLGAPLPDPLEAWRTARAAAALAAASAAAAAVPQPS